MSIRNLTFKNDINLLSNSLEIEEELKVKTQDKTNYINYQTPSVGTAGQVLTTAGDGTTSWTNKSGVSSGVSNPMSTNLDGGGFNIVNVPTYQNTNDLTLFAGNKLALTGGVENKLGVGFNTKIDIDTTTTSLLGNTIQCNNENILGVNEIHTDFLTSNQNAVIESLVDLNMSFNNINSVGTLQSSSVDTTSIANTAGDLFVNSNTDLQTNNISNINNTNTVSLTTTQINSNSGLNITATTGDITLLTTNNRLYGESLEMGTSLPQTQTIHIFEESALGSITTISGFDYYTLNNNTQYVIHGDLTLSAGINYGDNCSIKGETISSKIIFDESTKDIVGFRAIDVNCYLQDITTSGGGGHFTSNFTNGLFLCENYNTGAPAPFYGRNKRFRVVNCNILSAFNLGYIYGYGTLNFNNCFINGGGGAPTGIYTRQGLTLSDGLSFEFNANKIVLFAGAQVVSTTYMLRFINIDPLLQFNAVNVSSNIFHPRDNEIGILFEEGSKTALGLIGSNTIIRTGGVGDLISYPNISGFENYNSKEILNYEVIGNSGVINGEAVLQSRTTIHNSISNANWIDLSIPITSISAINKTKRFSLRLILTGVSPTSGYTVGNLLVSQTDPTKRAYIQEVQTILGGTQYVYINDMTGVFPDILNYKEQTLGLVDTGITSTGVQIGDNSGNIELKMIDKDPVDLQFGIQITYQNNGADDEVQYRVVKDTGGGYSQINQSLISHTVSRANRNDTATICFIERFNTGDLLKLQYRYIDITTTTIQSIELSAK